MARWLLSPRRTGEPTLQGALVTNLQPNQPTASIVTQNHNCAIDLSSAVKSWFIVASVSSPMFEMRNVVPLIFP